MSGLIARVQTAWPAVSAVVSRRVERLRQDELRDGDTVASVLMRLVRQALCTLGKRRMP